jgi:hypothetical protein
MAWAIYRVDAEDAVMRSTTSRKRGKSIAQLRVDVCRGRLQSFDQDQGAAQASAAGFALA